MRFLVTLLLSIYSFSALAIGLQNFDKYKANNALLASDIERLEDIVKSHNDPVYRETLDQYKRLFLNYDVLNSKLSLETFSKDAEANGWKNIRRMSQELSRSCEKGAINYASCREGLGKFKHFVINSNLDESNKDSVISFLNDYVKELNILASFDENFISKFNENSQAVNDKKFNVKPAPIIVNIKPVSSRIEKPKDVTVMVAPLKSGVSFGEFLVKTKEAIKGYALSVFENLVRVTFKDLLFFICSLGIFFLSVAIIHFTDKKRRIKSFQERVFRIARSNKMKIKVFGKSDFLGIKAVQKVEASLLESLMHSRLVSDTAHIKFKVKNNTLSVETLYFSKKSVQNFFDKESERFQETLKSLKQAVEENGGEFSFNNRFNHKGEITQTSYVISLPCN